jgi:HTH-type transcriptional regulator/antitoxin HipB
MSKEIKYGVVHTAAELGEIVRAHRKENKITLERVSGLGNLSTKFLSEFERGKETAEIGKIIQALRTVGLDLVVQPRNSNNSFHVNYGTTHSKVSFKHTPFKADKPEDSKDD